MQGFRYTSLRLEVVRFVPLLLLTALRMAVSGLSAAQRCRRRLGCPQQSYRPGLYS